MINPNWKTEAWYPEKNQLYQELQQSTTKSRRGKTRIMAMLAKTQDEVRIRTLLQYGQAKRGIHQRKTEI